MDIDAPAMNKPYAVFDEPGFNAAPHAPRQLRPAGFLRRAIAYAIDGVILLILYQCFLLAGLFGIRLAAGETLGFSDLGIGLLTPFISIAIAYFTFFHARGGQSPGKMVLRIQVLTQDRKAFSPLRALMRSLCYFVSALFFGLGFYLAFIGPSKRALHDRLTGTQVVLSP